MRFPGESSSEQLQTILVVDDAADTRVILTMRLQQEGFRVMAAGGAAEALAIIKRTGLPDLVLLDKMMPEVDGFELARILQTKGNVPIIFLSVQSDADTKVEGINRYAEDYIIKPFAYPELIARIRRVLDRTARPASQADAVVISEGVHANFADQYVIVNGDRISLTPAEARLLELLYARRGQVLSPDYLLERLWADADQAGSESLWLQIRRLRTKLGDDPADPRYLITVRGEGYALR